MKQRDLIAFAVFCGDWGEDAEDKTPAQVPYALERWQNTYVPALTEEHSGDCTKSPWTCMRCLVESWYNVADAIIALPGGRTAGELSVPELAAGIPSLFAGPFLLEGGKDDRLE